MTGRSADEQQTAKKIAREPLVDSGASGLQNCLVQGADRTMVSCCGDSHAQPGEDVAPQAAVL